MKAMYVIIDERLSKSQRIPQGSHSVVEFMHEYG